MPGETAVVVAVVVALVVALVVVVLVVSAGASAGVSGCAASCATSGAAQSASTSRTAADEIDEIGEVDEIDEIDTREFVIVVPRLSRQRAISAVLPQPQACPARRPEYSPACLPLARRNCLRLVTFSAPAGPFSPSVH
jgi:hypothetical protein